MNEWLKRRNQKTYKELDGMIMEWQSTGKNEDRIYEYLSCLADSVMKTFLRAMKMEFLNNEETKKDIIDYCMSKLNRYKSNGKPMTVFNFFTTIILGHLRQLYRTKKNYAELKEKWRTHVAKNQGGSR